MGHDTCKQSPNRSNIHSQVIHKLIWYPLKTLAGIRCCANLREPIMAQPKQILSCFVALAPSYFFITEHYVPKALLKNLFNFMLGNTWDRSHHIADDMYGDHYFEPRVPTGHVAEGQRIINL
jgi:hypothetical protein